MIAVDGKAVRGAKDRDGKAPHLIAALAHSTAAFLGQVAVDAKSSEIPAVREPLKAFTDLAGVVITIDALHMQSDTAKVILARQADYVMTRDPQCTLRLLQAAYQDARLSRGRGGSPGSRRGPRT